MTKSEFIFKLEEIAEAQAGSFKESDVLSAVGWDSMAVLGFQSLLDAELGTTVPVEQIIACKTVGDLVTLVKSRLAD
jgi:acyl carrier protein